MILVYEEEFGSHLVMMDSAIAMFSSIISREKLREGVEAVQELESECEEEELVLVDWKKKRLGVTFLGASVAAPLLGVSDSIIEPGKGVKIEKKKSL